jgi:hypothetical protein
MDTLTIGIILLLVFLGYKAAGSTTEDNIKARQDAADARYDRNKEKRDQTRKDIASVGKFLTGGGDKKKSGYF